MQRDAAILVRPARPEVTIASGGELAPGAEAKLAPALDRMLAGTGRASVGYGGAVRYDVAALVRALDDYGLLCLEQASSKGLPLALLPDGATAGEGRAVRLQSAVAIVLDKQRYDGGFGLWSASGEAETWLSAYATEFLLRARNGGAAVPEGAVNDALKFLADGLENLPSTPEGIASQAYCLRARARRSAAGRGEPDPGGDRRQAADPAGEGPTWRGACAHQRPPAGGGRLRRRPRVTGPQGLGRGPRQRTARPGGDCGAAEESGILPDRLALLLATLPGADLRPETLSTQEMAWAAAAAAVLGRDGRPARVAVNGRSVPPAPLVQVALTGPATARNLDERPVWQTLSASGVPADPLPAGRQAMRVTRKFFTSTGDTLDLDQLKQNTVFVLLIEGRADDAQDHRAVLVQGLPAGWEIAGRLASGKTAGMPWLGELTETEAQPAADDRFSATVQLTKDQPTFRIAVRLRAVTPGIFELPGAVLSDMYRPAIFARQNTGRIKVLAPE